MIKNKTLNIKIIFKIYLKIIFKIYLKILKIGLKHFKFPKKLLFYKI